LTPDITKQQRWGILGDGQLSRMLAIAAYPLGIRPIILTGDSSSPAGQVSPLIVRGHFDSRDDLHAILSQVDGALIESEFLDCDALEATGLAEKIIPPITCIRTLQDKLEQKRLLKRLEIPSAHLYEKDLADDLDWISRLTQGGQTPLVIKFAKLGYDGKGVLILNGEGRSDLERAEDFLIGARKRKISVYAEAKVDFKKELAMVIVRAKSGETKAWPLVISEQKQGICDRVMGPAVNLGVDARLEKTAQDICHKIAGHLGLVGVMAVEFFETQDGKLLVNEIAPRVHNSGHYTLNAGCASQFENHWRAALNLPLGSTDTTPFFVMQNILGVPDITSKECSTPPTPGEFTHIHWYGKRGIAPGRKLGHITAVCHDIQSKGDALSSVQSTYGRWQDQQRSELTEV
jgi:phosphoribosylaminoimidazole carboxylase PurK protein